MLLCQPLLLWQYVSLEVLRVCHKDDINRPHSPEDGALNRLTHRFASRRARVSCS
jgi:hypothetical protein